ncbi:hypothetical protein PR048_026215 [Dryococelus australis]|uniref:Uncharacterized protein n=1 Tax=Dryococelus australis TaxID=614101 RepID=A0ABQ9GKS3_9NEOP|nr:hypothetical protein PR048_026215 [Dryococelus australis]
MPLQYRQAKEALTTLLEHLPEGTVASARYLYIRASKTSAVIPSLVNRTPTSRWRHPWKILADPNLSSDLRAAAFGFYNNIVATQQRKYSIHLTADPTCPLCGNTPVRPFIGRDEKLVENWVLIWVGHSLRWLVVENWVLIWVDHSLRWLVVENWVLIWFALACCRELGVDLGWSQSALACCRELGVDLGWSQSSLACCRELGVDLGWSQFALACCRELGVDLGWSQSALVCCRELGVDLGWLQSALGCCRELGVDIGWSQSALVCCRELGVDLTNSRTRGGIANRRIPGLVRVFSPLVPVRDEGVFFRSPTPSGRVPTKQRRRKTRGSFAFSLPPTTTSRHPSAREKEGRLRRQPVFVVPQAHMATACRLAGLFRAPPTAQSPPSRA